jgi:hypothetical protein
MKETTQRDEQNAPVMKLRLIKGGLWGLTPKTVPAVEDKRRVRDLA